jgi:CheY-like chemotaxis protein
VDVAADGQQALTLAQAGDHALVLMDMQMPVMGGLEVTHRIRALPGWSATPILALTTHGFDADPLVCQAAGMNDFILKPMSIAALRKTLLQWLDLSEATAVNGPAVS